MHIECKASDYVVTKKDGMYYVYNKCYEQDEKLILATALFGLLLPDASDYYLPICIRIRDAKEGVVVTPKLNVIGTEDYDYFISRQQYEKWKRINAVIKYIFFIFSIVIDVLFVYLFLASDFNGLLGICVGALLFLTIGVILKLEITNGKRKRYKMIDMVFEQKQK